MCTVIVGKRLNLGFNSHKKPSLIKSPSVTVEPLFKAASFTQVFYKSKLNGNMVRLKWFPLEINQLICRII